MIFESPAILWALPFALLPTLIHLMGKRLENHAHSVFNVAQHI